MKIYLAGGMRPRLHKEENGAEYVWSWQDPVRKI